LDKLDWVDLEVHETATVRKDLRLQHADHIYATMQATNGALREVRNVSSTGVIVDRTPPNIEYLFDGPDPTRDQRFTPCE
jgi:hypothetical protein